MRSSNRISAVASIIPTLVSHPSHLRYLAAWKRTYWSNALKERKPWITFSARAWLDQNLSSTMRVYEFGSGGSTLYFSSRVSEVVSVEHNSKWYDLVRARIEQDGTTNVNYGLYAPELHEVHCNSELKDFKSNRYRVENSHFAAYVRSIERFSDESFDLVFIDGRARNACARHALPKVRKGGIILLDNSERSDYAPILEMLSGCTRIDFTGLCPYGCETWMTTAWLKDAL